MTEVQANYAIEAGKASRADFAMRADHASESERSDSAKIADRAKIADQAQVAEQAKQATYAMISREAERLNVAGNFVYIDPTNHYMIMFPEGTNPSKGMIFDMLNHFIYNVDQISDSAGTAYSKGAELTDEVGSSQYALSGLGGLKLQDKIDALERRVILLEAQLATFT